MVNTQDSTLPFLKATKSPEKTLLPFLKFITLFTSNSTYIRAQFKLLPNHLVKSIAELCLNFLQRTFPVTSSEASEALYKARHRLRRIVQKRTSLTERRKLLTSICIPLTLYLFPAAIQALSDE